MIISKVLVLAENQVYLNRRQSFIAANHLQESSNSLKEPRESCCGAYTFVDKSNDILFVRVRCIEEFGTTPRVRNSLIGARIYFCQNLGL